MNDRDLEQRVRTAFDEITVPDSVKKQTLEYVRSQANEQSVEVKVISSPSSSKRRNRRVRPVIFTGAIAACLLFAAALFGISNVGTQHMDLEPTAFVDIDINPSVQLKLNREDQVVEAEGINEDGANLLSDVPVVGMAYEEALNALTSSQALAPYLEQDAFVAVSIASSDQAQENALTSMSEEYLANAPYQGTCNGVSPEFYEEAHSHGMGCGRYAAAVELVELDPEVTIDECSTMSMRELRDRIQACQHEDQGQQSEQGAGQGQGSGSGRGMGHHGYHGGH